MQMLTKVHRVCCLVSSLRERTLLNLGLGSGSTTCPPTWTQFESKSNRVKGIAFHPRQPLLA